MLFSALHSLPLVHHAFWAQQLTIPRITSHLHSTRLACCSYQRVQNILRLRLA
jgi:hypothetical protein